MIHVISPVLIKFHLSKIKVVFFEYGYIFSISSYIKKVQGKPNVCSALSYFFESCCAYYEFLISQTIHALYLHSLCDIVQ